MKKIRKSLFLFLGLLSFIFGLNLFGSQAHAMDEALVMEPGDTGSVYYDTTNVYTMSGTKHGAPWSDYTAAMAINPDDGSAQKAVFCIEPGVPFISMDNPGYEAVTINNLSRDAKIVSIIWNTSFGLGTSTTTADRLTAQAVIWELLPEYGIQVNSISNIPDFQAKKQRLYDGINEYKKAPEFADKTYDLNLGETKNLESSVNLYSYDTLVANNAKVNWEISEDGYSVNVTPTDSSVDSGNIAFKRSFMEGTPIALKKQSSQTVYLPSIDDPAKFTVNFNIRKGQIMLEKSGVETGKSVWNGNYTLAGNTFDIRKDNDKGEVVATITTDDKGHAETPKNLPLGTYVVTEKTASNGFANTFKPVTVKIEYSNQTEAVIVGNASGTNQEVVGSTLLTKEDAETGAKTQGKATFDGATYGLFHQDGTPVKWSENFKPVSSKGNKLEGDDIQFEISDKQQQASVEHLALGNYYWQELIAPEGYQIDNTKREFAVTYKDQDTKVIETAATSKENVVKFKLDGFKYLESKGGEVASGYNGIDFTLTPVKPTKGEVQTTTTKTDANGYDGYWSFEVPYGDYTMSEVKAPEGYKTIKDLHIKSSFDSEKREYTFTITEDGQKEPIKTLTVAEADINKGSNVISLSKLFLTNKVQEIPEMPTIETLFATKDGSKDFDPSIDQELPDKVKATVPAEDIGKTFYYVTQFHKIDAEGKDTVVGTDESEHVAKDLSYEFDATYNYKANTLKDGEKLVATHIVYKDKEHKEEYAKHFDLTNEKQTLTAKTPATPITPTTPAGSSRSIPQTSGSLGGSMMWVVLGLVLASIGGFLVYRNKKNAVKE